ncbi:hypothetical protein E2C01_025443 [Portunus trituberculatus]|uniref:Uncharacterized protein n=1 Tax=Portunus trituberculatus TaxID=210409 RepID=A0A5B7EF79_PORTR|nr:hypothetical protein [Portunus trituberculatus]
MTGSRSSGDDVSGDLQNCDLAMSLGGLGESPLQPFCLCFPLFCWRGNKFWRFTANMASTGATGGTGKGKDNGGGDKDESERGKRAAHTQENTHLRNDEKRSARCGITGVVCLLQSALGSTSG